MRISRVDSRVEKSILIGMIVDRGFLARVSSKYSPSLLRNSYARTISEWCLDYFEKYDEAPKEKIQDIYDFQEREGLVREEDVDLIEKLLESVSDEYAQMDKVNVSFLIDKTEEHFNKVRIERTLAKTQDHLESGRLKEAQDELANSCEIKLSSGAAIDPLADSEKVRGAFEDVGTPLFTLGGDLGVFMNEHLVRDSFLCFQAPEKSGKTWMMYWLALQALKGRLKVVVFQIGDMTENQSITRLSIGVSRKSNKKQYCGEFLQPKKFIECQDEDDKNTQSAPRGYDVDYEMVDVGGALRWDEAVSNNEKFYRRHRIKKERYFRLITEPADTVNSKRIDSELDRLEKQEGFVADVIFIDYMDIMAAENSSDIGRDKINGNWIGIKSLTNKRHLLTISASQSDGQSYEGHLQTKSNFSNDKRKFSHVNGMIGMNQTDAEKAAGIMKLNWIVLREGEYNASYPCYLLQSLRRGMPVVSSLLPGKRLEQGPVSSQSSDKEPEKEKTFRRNGRRKNRRYNS